MDIMNHKIKFIRAVIDKVIRIVNRPIAEIHAAMDRLLIPHDIYQKSKTRNLSEEGIAELMATVAAKERERNIIQQTPTSQMWLNDLDEFEAAYRKEYSLKSKDSFVNAEYIPAKSLTLFPSSSDSTPKSGRQPVKPIVPVVKSTVTRPVVRSPAPLTLKPVVRSPRPLMLKLETSPPSSLTLNVTS